MSTISSKQSISSTLDTLDNAKYKPKKRTRNDYFNIKTKKQSKKFKHRNWKWDRNEMVQLYVCATINKIFKIFDPSIVPTRSSIQILGRFKNTKNLDLVCDEFWKKEFGKNGEKEDGSNGNLCSDEIILTDKYYAKLIRKMLKFRDSFEVEEQATGPVRESIKTPKIHQFTLDLQKDLDPMHKNKVIPKFDKISIEINDEIYKSLININEQKYKLQGGNNNMLMENENILISFDTIQKFFLKKINENSK